MNLSMMRSNPRGGPFLAAAVLAIAAAGCAAMTRPTGGAAESRSTTASPAGDAALERALHDALARKAWNDLRIDTECKTEAGLVAATVFGSGVGIWNHERQFALPRERVLALLREFETAHFPQMKESYDRPPRTQTAVELLCRVRLDLDGAAKQVHQIAKGPRSPELRVLADRILAVAEEAGRQGPGAASLADGLEKIARGELAPELLVLSILRQGEKSGAGEGWELVLDGGKARLQRMPVVEGEAQAPRRPPAEVAELARQLATARFEELPVNLWAPEYTDIEVRVLNHRRSLQARQFAGMTIATHGERQQRFDRLWAALAAWREKLLAERPS